MKRQRILSGLLAPCLAVTLFSGASLSAPAESSDHSQWDPGSHSNPSPKTRVLPGGMSEDEYDIKGIEVEDENPQEAIKIFSEGIAKYGSSGLYESRCRVYFYHFNDIPRAINDCLKAVALNPKEFYAFDMLANIYLHEKQYDNAIINANKAIALRQDICFPYLSRARAYLAKGAYDKALDDKMNAMIIAAKYQNDQALSLAEDWRLMVLEMRLQVNAKPDDRMRRVYLSLFYLQSKEYQSALEQAAILQDMNFPGGTPYYLRGEAYKGLGEYEKAREAHKKACELGLESSCEMSQE